MAAGGVERRGTKKEPGSMPSPLKPRERNFPLKMPFFLCLNKGGNRKIRILAAGSDLP